MGQLTPNLSLYKPGGGSTGTITPDETADVDKAINDNLDKIDTWSVTVDEGIEKFGAPVTTGIVSGTSTSWEVESQWGKKTDGIATIVIVFERTGTDLDLSTGANFSLASIVLVESWRPMNSAPCVVNVGTNLASIFGEAAANGTILSDGNFFMRRGSTAFGTVQTGDYAIYHITYALAE